MLVHLLLAPQIKAGVNPTIAVGIAATENNKPRAGDRMVLNERFAPVGRRLDCLNISTPRLQIIQIVAVRTATAIRGYTQNQRPTIKQIPAQRKLSSRAGAPACQRCVNLNVARSRSIISANVSI